MRKRNTWIAYLGIFGMGIVLILLGFSIVDTKGKQKLAEINQSALFLFMKSFSSGIENYEQTTMILYMNSECDHCQWQVSEIAAIHDLVSPIQCVFVSVEPEEQLLSFLNQFTMPAQLKVKILPIEPEQLDEVFGSSTNPQILIYKKGRLIKHFIGEVKKEVIKSVLIRG